MMVTLRTILWFSVFLFFPVVILSAQTPDQEQQPEFVKRGQQLMQQGKLEEALALYIQSARLSPGSFAANLATGNLLDLMGRGEEARDYLKIAIQVADTPEHRVTARRAMAMSYAFEGNCTKAIQHGRPVFDYYGSVKDFFRQGEIADEVARVCLDSGDLDTAYTWYQTGHDTGLKEPDIKPDRVDLWQFRWEHAQARIAARRGDKVGAQEHVSGAKAILDKGTNPKQAQFFPYLAGYVAFYLGDYKTALEELLNANQDDPFIQCLIGQTYEKLRDNDKAIEFYRKAAAATSHNPAAAYAVPFSKKRLDSLKSLKFSSPGEYFDAKFSNGLSQPPSILLLELPFHDGLA